MIVREQLVYRFPLLDQYLATLLDADLSATGPGQAKVIESHRRSRCEQSYGFIHAAWWIRLEDGRSVASVPPGAGEAVQTVLADIRNANQMSDSAIAEQLRTVVNRSISKDGPGKVNRVHQSVSFACNASLMRWHAHGDCRRLVDESMPPAEGLTLPMHCFPDGIVYGVVVDGKVVAVAHAHRSGIMEDRVADLAVETARAYRRRGYAKTVVAAVVEHITSAGGEARYATDPDNKPSIATASSVGFVPYARSLILSAPAGDLCKESSI